MDSIMEADLSIDIAALDRHEAQQEYERELKDIQEVVASPAGFRYIASQLLHMGLFRQVKADDPVAIAKHNLAIQMLLEIADADLHCATLLAEKVLRG